MIVSLAEGGQVLDVMTGQNGFLRGTLRGFARTRRMDGVGSLPPLRLTGYADGRLTLFDPSTHRTVELEAFGSQNEAVFRAAVDDEAGRRRVMAFLATRTENFVSATSIWNAPTTVFMPTSSPMG